MGEYIWEWYTSINQRVSRIKDGVCYLIPLSEYVAWQNLTGNIVYPWEYDILLDMDKVFCIETNNELRSQQEKEREKLEKNRSAK